MIWRFVTPKRCCILCAAISYIVPAVLWAMLSHSCTRLCFDSVWLARHEGYRVEHRQIVGWKRPELNDPFWIDHFNSNMGRMDTWDLFGYGLVGLSMIPTTAFVLGACVCQEMEDKQARRESRKAKGTES